MSAFGSLLRKHRDYQAITQVELAEASGLAIDTLRSYERGRRTPRLPQRVFALIDALGLDNDEATELVAACGVGPASTFGIMSKVMGIPIPKTVTDKLGVNI